MYLFASTATAIMQTVPIAMPTIAFFRVLFRC